jgi:hypothetical protein
MIELRAEREMVEVTMGPGPWGPGDRERRFIPGLTRYFVSVHGVEIEITEAQYQRLAEVQP